MGSLSTSFHVGYSKSQNAICHGPAPCKGTRMPPGTLRIGKVIKDEYSETVEWRHWGCITFDWLRLLRVNSLSGLETLQPQDQQKIQLAISLQRIDPLDIPQSAKSNSAVQPVGASSLPQKRRAQVANPTSASQMPASSQQARQYAALTGIDEYDDDYLSGEEDSPDELCATLRGRVVGLRYYSGLVGAGEEVRLIREPGNRYDRNAIQVKNIANQQVGHIKRELAAVLAPSLDNRTITVEGAVLEGNVGWSAASELPICIRVFSSAAHSATIRVQLKNWVMVASDMHQPSSSNRRKSHRSYLPSSSSSWSSVANPTPQQLAEQHQREEELSKAAELSAMVSGLERVDDDERRDSLLDKLCGVDDILALPLHPNPPGKKAGSLTVDLLKHQSQALAWALEKEYPKPPQKESDKPVQFWQLAKGPDQTYYVNIATKTPQKAAPILGRGALNADAMGLGKTLTMLSLILATMGDVPAKYSKSTLIVCPLSILSNWEQQIQDHVTPGFLSFHVYHGSGRSLSAKELKRYDVVITTYQTVAGEFSETPGVHSSKKRKADQALFAVPWKRIILDEGHNIRNPKTKTTKACCALDAERRWILSGTPIINSPRDLGSMLSFLRICAPLDNEDYYKRLVIRPLKNADPSGAQLLRGIMSSICIRRTKEMQDKNGKPLVPLPTVEMIKVPVALTAEARALYDEVEAISKDKVEQFLSRSSQSQSGILSMLTRMRQIALHPNLVPANYVEELRTEINESSGTAKSATLISPQEKLRLQIKLAQALEDLEECPICFVGLSEPRITVCGHTFCFPCIAEVIRRDPKCPMDRNVLSMDALIEPLPPGEFSQTQPALPDEQDEMEYAAGSSAKIQQLIHLLKLQPRTEKGLVFSQFTTFLDKIEAELKKEGIKCVRFDGKMSAKRRQETLARFCVPLSDPATASTHRSSQFPMAVDDDDDDDDYTEDENVSARRSRRRVKGKQKADSSSPAIMLISLKAGALGLNLTVANNVYLMDPWWQEGIESQAIDRVNRIGQTKNVRVYQLIAENTIESKVLEIQERKKKIISEAFAGIKRTETQRTQREARLQDLVELFGIRDQNENRVAR